MEIEETTNSDQRPLKPVCLNCEETMPRKAKFCPHCGQRNNKGKVTMREFLLRFWNNISHLDSKFIRVFWELLIPGRVTIEYFKGKQRRYPHPVQFFFVVAFFFLLAFSNILHRSDAEEGASTYFEDTKGKILATKRMQSYRDSLPADLQQQINAAALDKLLYRANDMHKFGEKDSSDYIFIDDLAEFHVSTRDMYCLSPDSIGKKYYPQDKTNAYLLTQAMKVSKAGRSVVYFYVKSFAWTMLGMIAILSVVLYVINRKHGHYYVEAFVLLMHLFSGFMLLTAMFLYLEILINIPNLWTYIAGGWIIVGLLWAIKFYYKRTWFSSIFQWLIALFTGSITFIIMFLASLVIALLTY